MLKGLTTTITLATGTTVLALSLPLFAGDSAVVENADHIVKPIEKTAELPHPAAPPSPSQNVEKTAPTPPSAPSEPFAQSAKEEAVDDKASTKSTAKKPSNAEIAAPSGLFSTQEKPSAPQQPVLSETTKKGEKVIPAEPIPVALGVVSMGMNPTSQVEEKEAKEVKKEQQEKQVTGKAQTYAEPLQVSIDASKESAPAKPEAPTSMEKPVEMTPPQPEKNTSGNGREGNASSMNMPTMNMNMPQINMPTMNMSMPTTSMGATTAPQAVSMPVPVPQPATSVEH